MLAMLPSGGGAWAQSASALGEAAAAVRPPAPSTDAAPVGCEAPQPIRGGNAADVVSLGGRRSSLGGRVVLVGASVRRELAIDASTGRTVEATWPRADVVDSMTPRVRVRLDAAAAGDVVDLESMRTPGGRVDVHAAAVNQRGIVRADAMRVGPSGEMILTAGERPAGAIAAAGMAGGLHRPGGAIALIADGCRPGAPAEALRVGSGDAFDAGRPSATGAVAALSH